VPDSGTAGRLIRKLQAQGETEVDMHGPTVEQVFLNLTKDVDASMEKDYAGTMLKTEKAAEAMAPLESGRVLSSWRQILVLMRKRFTVLPRYWIGPLIVLVLPCVLPSQLAGFIDKYKWPTCDKIITQSYEPYPVDLGQWDYYSGSSSGFWYESTGPMMILGPQSANKSLGNVVENHFPVLGTDDVNPFNLSHYTQSFDFFDSYPAFQDYIKTHVANYTMKGGIWMGDGTQPDTLTYQGDYGRNVAGLVLNLYTSMRTGVKIGIKTGTISSVGNSVRGDAAVFWVLVSF